MGEFSRHEQGLYLSMEFPDKDTAKLFYIVSHMVLSLLQRYHISPALLSLQFQL